MSAQILEFPQRVRQVIHWPDPPKNYFGRTLAMSSAGVVLGVAFLAGWALGAW